MAIAMVVSIYFFSDQIGLQRRTSRSTLPELGDLAFEVGFVLAALVYTALFFSCRAAPTAKRCCSIPDETTDRIG